MNQPNIIIQGVNAGSSFADIIKKGVVAIGCFVVSFNGAHTVIPLNPSTNFHPLIQRGHSVYAAQQSITDKLLINYDNRQDSTVIVRMPMLKPRVVGYTRSTITTSENLEASQMTKRHYQTTTTGTRSVGKVRNDGHILGRQRIESNNENFDRVIVSSPYLSERKLIGRIKQT